MHFFLDFFSSSDNAETMNGYDGRRDCTQEFWKLAISSQISMLDAMANALSSFPNDMRAGWVRDMYRTNANIFNYYFQMMEQAGTQSVEIQLDALRQSSNALKAVLSNMQGPGTPPQPK
jgi:hypothetical protein